MELRFWVDWKMQKCQKESMKLRFWVDWKMRKCQKESIELRFWVDCKSVKSLKKSNMFGIEMKRGKKICKVYSRCCFRSRNGLKKL